MKLNRLQKVLKTFPVSWRLRGHTTIFCAAHNFFLDRRRVVPYMVACAAQQTLRDEKTRGKEAP